MPTPTNEDITIKVVKMESDIRAIRTAVTHSDQMTRVEMSNVQQSMDRIGDAVELLLSNSQETEILRKDLSHTQHKLSELNIRMDKRQEVTDPIIIEAKEFLASFRTGTAVLLKALGVLQIVFILWLGYNETRISKLQQDVQQMQLTITSRTHIIEQMGKLYLPPSR